MLYLCNTVELIIQVSSNFHFIFCFCNLIILFVLISHGSKPRSNRSVIRGKTVNPSSFRADYNGVISNASSIKGNTDDHNAENEEQGRHSAETGSMEIQIYDESSLENEEVNSSSEDEIPNPERVVVDDDDDDDDDGDEFRRKIEEFIDKVNKEWRKEKLRINNDD